MKMATRLEVLQLLVLSLYLARAGGADVAAEQTYLEAEGKDSKCIPGQSASIVEPGASDEYPVLYRYLSQMLHDDDKPRKSMIAKVLIDCDEAMVNFQAFDGRTPLIVAILKDMPDVVKVLIERKASINMADEEGWTPLHHATGEGNAEVVKILVEAGANINTADTKGNTALHLVVKNGNEEMANILLGADGIDVNVQDGGGNTPLHMSIMLGDLEFVRMLLENGADPNIKTAGDSNKNTALHLAVESGNEEITKILLGTDGICVNAQNKDGDIPLHWAAGCGNVEAVKVLVGAGADVNAKNKDGDTPLHWAARCGNVEAANVFISFGADVNAQNRDGDTPLHLTIESGNAETIWMLVRKIMEEGFSKDHGSSLVAALHIRNGERNTPLHIAIHNGDDKLAAELIYMGIQDLESQNGHRSTALHKATCCQDENGTKKTVGTLGMSFQSGNQSQHLVLYDSYFDIVEKIIRCKRLYKNTQRAAGAAPLLHLAAYYGDVVMVKILLEAGADVNETWRREGTPLDIASREGHSAVREILLAAGEKKQG